jgi:hypothetical protein
MLCQTVLDFYWKLKPAMKVPDHLLDRLQTKIKKLKKTLHEWCGRGVKAEQARDLLKLYQVCANKLKAPGSRPLYEGIELDSNIQFFLKCMTEKNYEVSEYDVEMNETRLKLETQAHRSRTEEYAHVLVSHSILFGVLAQNNEQHVKLMRQALDIFEKADCMVRVPILRQSLDAAIRDEAVDRSQQVVQVLDLKGSSISVAAICSSISGCSNLYFPDLLKMDPKIGHMILFGRQSALKYYQQDDVSDNY